MYKRNCPICEKELIYSSYSNLINANRRKSNCSKCSANKVDENGLTHLKKVVTKHGLRYTKEYILWKAIKNRCYNPNAIRYEDWGGRGISMDDKWVNNPVLFCEYLKTIENYDKWISENKSSYSIDRIDNNGGYVEGNLRFATKIQQNINTRRKTNTGHFYISKNKFNTYTLRITGVIKKTYKTLEEALEVRQKYIEI